MRDPVRKTPEWLYLVVLCIAGISVVSHGFTMIPIEGYLVLHFNNSKDLMYLSSSIFSVFYAFGFLIFGPLSDRFGKKTIVVSGLSALFLCTLMLGFCKTYSLFLIFRAIQGLVAATFTPLALAYVFELFVPKHRGIAIGFLSTSFIMASIVGQLVSYWLTSKYGLSYLFFVFAFVHLFFAIVLHVLLPKSVKNNQPLSSGYWLDMFRLIRNSGLTLSYGIAITQFLSFVAFYSSLQPLLAQTYNLTGSEIMLFRSVGIIGMFASPFMNKFITNFGAKSVIMLGLTTTGIGALLFLIGSGILFLSIASVVFVAGISIVLPAIIFHVGHVSGERKGSAMSLYTFSLFLGSSATLLVILTILRFSFLLSFFLEDLV